MPLASLHSDQTLVISIFWDLLSKGGWVLILTLVDGEHVTWDKLPGLGSQGHTPRVQPTRSAGQGCPGGNHVVPGPF